MKRPWFEVLNVSPDADLEDAKTAMRRLIFAYHSDRLRSIEGLHPDFYKFADDHLKEINQAYEEAKAVCKSRLAQGRNNGENHEPLRSKIFTDLIVGNQDKRDFEFHLSQARQNGQPLGHLLIIGRSRLPLNKIARIIAIDLGVKCIERPPGALKTVKDLAACLSSLEDRDICPIDDMELLKADSEVEGVLVSAMQKFDVDLIIRERESERNVVVELAHFTVIGAEEMEHNIPPRLLDAFKLRVHVA